MKYSNLLTKEKLNFSLGIRNKLIRDYGLAPDKALELSALLIYGFISKYEKLLLKKNLVFTINVSIGKRKIKAYAYVYFWNKITNSYFRKERIFKIPLLDKTKIEDFEEILKRLSEVLP